MMELMQQAELICKVYVRREILLGMSLNPYAEVLQKIEAEKHVEAFGGFEKKLSFVIDYCGMTCEEAEPADEDGHAREAQRILICARRAECIWLCSCDPELYFSKDNFDKAMNVTFISEERQNDDD